MKIYVVLREGVHIQGVAGAHLTQAAAESAARQAARAEPDNYHQHTVQEVVVGATHVDPEVGRGTLYRTRRNTALRFYEETAAPDLPHA